MRQYFRIVTRALGEIRSTFSPDWRTLMTKTHFIWDFESDNLLMEKDWNGNTTSVYTNEPGDHGKLISQCRDGQSFFHHIDANSDSRAITDQNENVVETATYSAFGEVVQKSSSIVNPFWLQRSSGLLREPWYK